MVSLAKKGTSEELIKLLEIVVFTIVNCPMKEEFICNIMQLDSEVQTSLMHLIQGTLLDTVKSEPQSETRALHCRLQEFQEQFDSLEKENSALLTEKQQLEAKVRELEGDIAGIYGLRLTNQEEVDDFIDRTLHEKDSKITQLQEVIDEERKRNSSQVNALTLELDLANIHIEKLTTLEETVHSYRTRLEEGSALREKNTQLTKYNEELKKNLQDLKIKLGEYVRIKQEAKRHKEALRLEKDKNESLSFQLRSKTNELHKLTQNCRSQQEKLALYKAQNNELEMELRALGNGTPSSEDSMISANINFGEDLCRESPRRVGVRRSTLQHIPVFTERDQFLCQLSAKKSKIGRLKEAFQMQTEDLYQTVLRLQTRLSQLANSNQLLNLHVQQVDKFVEFKTKFEVARTEIEHLKESKSTLMEEITKLYEEKESLYKDFIKAKEELLVQHSELSEREILLKHREIAEQQLHDRIQELTEQEKLNLQEIQQLKACKPQADTGAIDRERELVTKSHQIASLLLRLSEKEQWAKDQAADKQAALARLTQKHSESTEKLQTTHRRKLKKLLAQTEEALSELQREKELLAHKLKNSFAESLSALNKKYLSESCVSPQEFQKLQQELKRKQSDIEYLTIANIELKHVWKDTAKMLKKVWKVIGTETKRIESASRRTF